jgi:hypothetical protein
MKKAIILGLLANIFLVVAQLVQAQPPDPLWTNTYGGTAEDEAFSIQCTSDGGYVIAGYTCSFGSGYQAYLVKIDANGNQSWESALGGSHSEYAFDVRQTTDGGYIVVGSTDSYGTGDYDVYLIKTNPLGNLVWQRTFGGTGEDDGYSVRQTIDGGYIIAGRTESFGAGGSDVLLIRTDANGNMLWQHTFGGTSRDESNWVEQTSDGGYILCGSTASYGIGTSDVYLIKTDANGNLTWQQTYGGVRDEYGYCVQPTSEGGYVISGATIHPPNISKVYVVKTDDTGNLTWEQSFGRSGLDYGAGIRQTMDGGYAIVGRADAVGPLWHPFASLYKTDTQGNLVWQQNYGGYFANYGYSMQFTPDGGYIIAGSAFAFEGFSDVYVVRTDAGGSPTSLTIAPATFNPIVIPANGGSFQYQLHIHNWTTQPQTFSIWNTLRDSVNQYYAVFGPITRTLPGGANPTHILTQTVAGTIPSGTLYFISYIGTYPNTVVDSSYFAITKSMVADDGPWISESTCKGDVFDEYTVENGRTHSVMSLPGSAATSTTVISPNPFNPTTVASYELRVASHVSLRVYNTAGRLINTLVDGWQAAGPHSATFDGSELAAAVYLVRLEAGNEVQVEKVVLLK